MSGANDAARRLELIRAASARTLDAGTAHEAWRALSEELARGFACGRALLLRASEGGALVSRPAPGAEEPVARKAGEGAAGKAVRTGRRALDGGVLAQPLAVGGRTAGVLELSVKPGGFGAEDEADLEALAPALTALFVRLALEEDRERTRIELLQTEKLAAIGRLVAGFTHEVRGPLFAIQGFAERLELGLDDPEQVRLIERMKANVKRVEDLMKNLLGFSRVSATTIGPVDLCAVAEMTLELVTLEPRWRAFEIVRDLDRAAPTINGNANTLMQVLFNLCVNALQAMDARGRGRLSVRVRSGSNGLVVVEIADDGPGIPPEVRERIFEPFFSTKGTKGTGLGLYLVAEIVAGHGGKIAAESSAGRGTVFTLTFPAGA
jgi:signal transduction histidine kinase